MAAYRRVYDSRHLQADCQEPGSAPEPYALVIEYGIPRPFLLEMVIPRNQHCASCIGTLSFPIGALVWRGNVTVTGLDLRSG